MATAAERKRRQRERMEEAINEQPSSEWDEATCLWVLQRKDWKHGAIGEAAWERLGEIHGYGKQRRLV